MDFTSFGVKIGVFYVPFLFALCVHEYAHGLVAKWRGDNTADQMGRLTLNPLAHMDLLGTFIFPIFSIISGIPLFFGWANPVPVNVRNLKNIRTDMFWIALAGPASNILLAVLGTTIAAVLWAQGAAEMYIVILQMFVLTNLSLAVFNMIPLHPLDGAKVLSRFLPHSLNYKIEQNQQISSWILIAFIMLGRGIIGVPITFLFLYLMGFAGVPYMIIFEFLRKLNGAG